MSSIPYQYAKSPYQYAEYTVSPLLYLCDRYIQHPTLQLTLQIALQPTLQLALKHNLQHDLQHTLQHTLLHTLQHTLQHISFCNSWVEHSTRAMYLSEAFYSTLCHHLYVNSLLFVVVMVKL